MKKYTSVPYAGLALPDVRGADVPIHHAQEGLRS
jgi:hypothetical protein